MSQASLNRRAARGVALHDPNPDLHERKIILEELGLISSADVCRPPILERTRRDAEANTESLQSLENSPTMTGAGVRYDPPLLDRSSIPEGLRNFQAAEPAPPPPPRVRKIPQPDPEKCGTLAGRSLHSKRNRMLIEAGLLGDPSCDKCREFYTAYQRKHRERRKLAKVS